MALVFKAYNVPVMDANNNARQLQQCKVKIVASQQNHQLATVEDVYLSYY